MTFAPSKPGGDGDSFSPGGVRVVEGDLLEQPVEAIVNAWNRNVPWWLLLPQGVSGAIKRRAGVDPFHELARHGPIPLGGAVATGGAAALPQDHPCCRDQHAVAGEPRVDR